MNVSDDVDLASIKAASLLGYVSVMFVCLDPDILARSSWQSQTVWSGGERQFLFHILSIRFEHMTILTHSGSQF